MLAKTAVLLCLLTNIACAKPRGIGDRSTPQHELGKRSGGSPVAAGHRHPVIFVPGLGGTQLWAKLNHREHKPHFYCYSSTGSYYNIWLSLSEVAPGIAGCTMENMRLHYNPVNHTTHNTQGVDIKVLNFGHPKSVEWLDPFFDDVNHFDTVNAPVDLYKGRGRRNGYSLASVGLRSKHNYVEALSALSLLSAKKPQAVRWLDSKREWSPKKRLAARNWKESFWPFSSELIYFADMAKTLVSKGYRRGEDLRAAPYDFRKAPNEMADYFNKTKHLIEETYAKNGNSRVVMVAHSMGNPVMLYFYNRVVSQQWKDKYIRSHVALSAPWGGALKSVKLMISGDSLGISYLGATTIREVERSMVSTAWLLPSPSLWGDHEVLVTTPQNNYTVRQYRQLFHDLGYMDGYRMWEDTRDLISDLKFPGIEMHCLYGRKVKTAGRLVYEGSEFPNSAPQEEIDDGDGTVNIRSLEAFKRWLPQKQQHPRRQHRHLKNLLHRNLRQSQPPITVIPLNHVTHGGILKDSQVIQYVLQVATG